MVFQKRFHRYQAMLLSALLSVAVFGSSWAQSGNTPIQGRVQQAKEAAKKPVVYKDASQQAQMIVNRLQALNQLPKETVQQIQVIESDDLNAATNGQQIVVTSRLWKALKTDDQKAFVISHEMSHITLNHVGHTQVRQLGLGVLDYILTSRMSSDNSMRAQFLQLATSAGLGMVENRFSRQQEYQADDFGMQMLTKAGYRPHAAVEVFDILQANTPGNNVPEFLQNHPLSKSRIQALVQKYPNAAR